VPHLLLLARVAALIAAVAIAGRLAVRSRGWGQVRLGVAGDRLAVQFRGWDLLLAGRRSLSIPLGSIEAVCVRQVEPVSGLPLWGSVLPGGLRVGTFLLDGEREFWLLRKPGPVLFVELAAGAPWSRLVLQVPDPQQAALALRRHARTLVPAWL
jgi:hypothetical protein